METLKQHWESIYEKKSLMEVSWYEPIPETSLSFIEECYLLKDAAIIDIGGGDSFFSEGLLKEGYTNLSVLDISGKSIQRAKERLGKNANKIHWVESDILDFKPAQQYDVWHDRAAFHFLTHREDQKRYIQIVHHALRDNGYLLLAPFSDAGPDKCSGLPVQQYSEESMEKLLNPYFKKVKCIRQEHATPFNTMQSFLFCSFKRLRAPRKT